MAKFDVQLPFAVRQAIEVASSLSLCAVDADLRFGRGLLESTDVRCAAHPSGPPDLLRASEGRHLSGPGPI